MGLHKKGSTYDVLTASDCKLVHPDMTAILSCVLDFFTELGAVHYKKMQHTGYLRHLLLRRGVTSGEILVHVITTSQAQYDYAPLVSRLLALPLEGKIVGIMHIINDSLSDVVQSDETQILYGQDYFYETLLGLRFKISTFSFFQPNSLAAEVLYSIVRDYIGDTKDKEVFDLYSGTGTIAQLLASVAKEVIGVEIVEEAVEAAKVNAALNGLTNCRFIAGDVLKALDDLTEKPDMIVLDPPRDGIHPQGSSKDPCIRRRKHRLHLLQTHQPGPGPPLLPRRRLPDPAHLQRGPVLRDGTLRDNLPLEQPKTRCTVKSVRIWKIIIAMC